MKLTRRSALAQTGAFALYRALPRPDSVRAGNPAGESTESLWHRTIHPFLLDDQWTERYSYDAGHVLMVPLHAAFGDDTDPAWREDFMAHAERFQNHLEKGGPLPENRINRLQYLYLWTQHALLAAEQGSTQHVSDGLLVRIRDEHSAIWSQSPAPQWGRDPFAGGVRERLAWKRDVGKTEPSYYRAIIDEELFSFAIAADLVALGVGEDDALEAVRVADAVFRERGAPLDDGGWLFDPGVWEDHPDYAYAGNPVITEHMEKKPVEGIAGDTSHAHRLSRWLRSLEHVPGDEDRSSYYAEVRSRLNTQFMNKVLVPPVQDFPAYRTTNFLDGNNGVYRWEYSTQGEGNGYGPYELSGTLSLGWWTFLASEESRELYAAMSASFPLPSEVVDLYVGPNTTRERHALAALPAYYIEGLGALVARLASTVSSNV